jgi:hypothetical protein
MDVNLSCVSRVVGLQPVTICPSMRLANQLDLS